MNDQPARPTQPSPNGGQTGPIEKSKDQALIDGETIFFEDVPEQVDNPYMTRKFYGPDEPKPEPDAPYYGLIREELEGGEQLYNPPDDDDQPESTNCPRYLSQG